MIQFKTQKISLPFNTTRWDSPTVHCLSVKVNKQLTIARQSNTGFFGKLLITEMAIGIVVTVLQPLQITLHHALEKNTSTLNGSEQCWGCRATWIIQLCKICNVPCVNVSIEWLDAQSKIRKYSLHENDLTGRVIFNRERSMLASRHSSYDTKCSYSSKPVL